MKAGRAKSPKKLNPGPASAVHDEEAFVLGTREAVARIRPALRRLERLRDDARSRPEVSSDGADSRVERVVPLLVEILERAILAIEEGWVELDDCFSRRGLARLRQKARRVARQEGP